VNTLELSCGLPPGPDFADLAVLAEGLGYARVWIFDSAPLWEDAFAHLALAAARTSRIGLATAVLIPTQRSVMAMASGIATIHRMSDGRFRACFGTGYTARMAIGQRAMPLDALSSTSRRCARCSRETPWCSTARRHGCSTGPASPRRAPSTSRSG
jgi:5,10-methylenetetrahydromethanopterin reductase